MNSKQKIFIIVGFIFVVMALLFFLIIKPMIFEIDKVSATVTQSRDKLLLIETTDESYFKQIESDYKEITENIAIIKTGLIDANQAVGFFMELEKIASQTYNQLKIDATNFPILDLTLTGDFPNLMRFLGWLEKGKYFLDVESVDSRQIIEKELLAETSVAIKSNIKIKVYTKKQK